MRPQKPQRIRHRDVSMLVSVCSFALVVGGSGGVLAGISHTGLVFDQGFALYLQGADEASGEGIGLLHASVARGLEDELGAVREAESQAEEKAISARAKAEAIDTEMRMVVTPRDLQEVSNRASLTAGRLELFRALNDIFVEAQRIERERLRRPDYSIKVGFKANLDGGPPRTRLYSVPWTDKEGLAAIQFQCVLFPGWNDGECDEEEDTRIKSPDAVSLAAASPKAHVNFALPSNTAVTLQRYVAALQDLERVVFYNALDLRRVKGWGGSLDEGTLNAVNAEVGRTELGLERLRKRIQDIREVEKLVQLGTEHPATAVLLEEMRESFLRSEVPKGGNSANLLADWVAATVPKFTARSKQDREKEILIRKSAFYRSLRPLLANIWVSIETGSVGWGGWFTRSAPLQPRTEVPGSFSAATTRIAQPFAVSTWAVVLVLLLSVCSCLWFVRERLAVASTLQRRSVFFLAPPLLLAWLLPVWRATNANLATPKHAEGLTSSVIARVIKADALSRGAMFQASLSRKGKERAAAIKSEAEARASVVENLALQEKTQREYSLTTLATQEMGIMAIDLQFYEGFDRMDYSNKPPSPAGLVYLRRTVKSFVRATRIKTPRTFGTAVEMPRVDSLRELLTRYRP